MSTLVYREECVYCFQTWVYRLVGSLYANEQEDASGIDICLSCYLGFCTGVKDHSRFHYEKTGHSTFLRIHRQVIQPASNEPTPLTKLAIGVEGGLQEVKKEYETTMHVVCHACPVIIPAEGYVILIQSNYSQYHDLGERILLRVSGEKEKELCSWEAENLKPCPHCEQYRLPSPCPQITSGMF